jgi:hypothetical protein
MSKPKARNKPKKELHPEFVGKLPYVANLPFTERWLSALKSAYDAGGWHVISGGPHHGKSVSNLLFARSHNPGKQPDGKTSIPVAITIACPQSNVLLHELADSLGLNPRMFRHVNAITAIVQAAKVAGLQLIIVNNAHELDWRQWEKLLALFEAFLKAGLTPGIVLSSISESVGTLTLRSSDDALMQIKKRVFYVRIPGHSKSEVSRALELLLRWLEPKTLEDTDVLDFAALAWEELTSELFDPLRTRRVATVDLHEVAMRIVALYEGGERSGDQLMRLALADYRLGRSQAADLNAA